MNGCQKKFDKCRYHGLEPQPPIKQKAKAHNTLAQAAGPITGPIHEPNNFNLQARPEHPSPAGQESMRLDTTLVGRKQQRLDALHLARMPSLTRQPAHPRMPSLTRQLARLDAVIDDNADRLPLTRTCVLPRITHATPTRVVKRSLGNKKQKTGSSKRKTSSWRAKKAPPSPSVLGGNHPLSMKSGSLSSPIKQKRITPKEVRHFILRKLIFFTLQTP